MQPSTIAEAATLGITEAEAWNRRAERSNGAKLTNAQVADITAKYRVVRQGRTQRSNAIALAGEYGVSANTIQRVATGGRKSLTTKAPRSVGVVAERKCLRCGDNFSSTHVGNRMCIGCRGHANKHRSGMD